MPAVQSCDPAAHGRTYNTLVLYEQGITVEVNWTWDTVSVWPQCDGPLVNGAEGWAIKAVNPFKVAAFYVHSNRKNGQPKTYTLNPSSTALITAGQAAFAGYDVITDFNNLTFSTTP